MPDVRMPNGMIIRGVPEGTTKDELLRRLQRNGYDTKELLRAQGQPKPAPKKAKPKEEESTLSALGRAFQRGLPTIGEGIARIAEDAPEIVAAAASVPVGALSPVAGQAIRDLGRVAAKSDTVKDVTGKPVQELRRQAAESKEALGPRKFAGVFEEEGIGRKLGSLAETVAESALPTVTGIATGLVTRSPTAAGAVMSSGIVPMTYGGVRERQEAEGIDSVPRALLGTAASSALDVLTGVGGKVLSSTAAIAAKETLEGGLRQAVSRVLQTGTKEAGTEMLQTVIEQVAGGSDPTTKQSMLETLEGGLAGALGGTVFSGVTEAVAAPFRPRAEQVAGETPLTPETQRVALQIADADVQRRVAAGQPREQAIEEVTANAKLYADAATQLAASGTPLTSELLPTVLPPFETAAEVGAAPTDQLAGVDAGPAGAGVPSPVSEPAVAPAPAQLDLPFGTGVEAGSADVVVGDAAQGSLDTPLMAEPPVTTPIKLRLSNPGGDWEARKRAQAETARSSAESNVGLDARMLTGATTGEVSSVKLPTAFLKQLEGVEGERPGPGQPKYEALLKAVTEEGFDPKKAGKVMVWVNHAGEAFIYEGNNRVAVAANKGVPVLDVEIQYRNGAENVAGPLSPENVQSLQQTSASLPVSENAQQTDPAQLAGTLLEQAPAAATEMGVNPTYFGNAVRDFVSGTERSMTPEQLEQVAGPEAARAYEAGRLWAEETAAEQAAPAAQAEPVEAAPVGQAEPVEAAPQEPAELTVAEPISAEPAPQPTQPVQPAAPQQPLQLATKLGLSKPEQKRILEAMGVKQAKGRKALTTIRRTRDAVKLNDAQIEYGKLMKGDKEQFALLRAALGSLKTSSLRTLLPTLPTDDIFRLLDNQNEGLKDVDKIIRQDIRMYDTSELERVADETQAVAEFAAKFPAAVQVVSDVQFLTQAYEVDPRKAATPEAYARTKDAKTKQLQQALAQEKDPKKRTSLKGQITRRLNEIKTVYEGGIPTDEDGNPLQNDPVFGYNDLARPKFGGNKGKKVFSMIADAHRRDLEEYYKALQTRIRDQYPEEADQVERLTALRDAFKPALERVIYFPLMRHGEFYMRIGGKNGTFVMFETRMQMELAKAKAMLAGEEVSDSGPISELRQERLGGAGADAALGKVLDMVRDDNFSGKQVREQVYQMYLSAIPGNSIRARMANRKLRAGYSTDILKNFYTARRSAIQARKGATFAYKIENGLDRAKSAFEGQPDSDRMKVFAEEIAVRARAEMNPMAMTNGVGNALINLGTTAAFYWYLATPKAALVQLTQSHVVSLPILSDKFGTAKSAAALSKYMATALGKTAAAPFKAFGRDADGDMVYRIETPTLEPQARAGEDPQLAEALREGWKFAQERNVFMETYAANTITGLTDPAMPSTGRRTPTLLGSVKRVGTTMAATFHQMERINREATYMAALELAYREARTNKVPHAKAMEQAQETALGLTYEATFDFSTYNKPSLFTTRLGGMGRLAFQFFTYPLMMNSLIVRNTFGAMAESKDALKAAVKGDFRTASAEGKQAFSDFRVAAGVLGNIALWGGIAAIPLYGLASMGALVAAAVKDLLDDEDEEYGLPYVDDADNIRWTYDFEAWFRQVWIPEFFGPEGTVASALGLDEETAAFMSKAAEKGPISAATDLDLSNSMALDFLFFLPDERRSPITQGGMEKYVFDLVTGASGGILQDLYAAKNFLQQDEPLRALEKAPRLVGNIPKAFRIATEGQKNVAGNKLVGLNAAAFTDEKVLAQMLGFASTEGARRTEEFYRKKRIADRIQKEKSDILQRISKNAVDTYDESRNPAQIEADHKAIIEDVIAFGALYPDNPITMADILEQQSQAIEDLQESESAGGLPLGLKYAFARESMMRRIREDSRQK